MIEKELKELIINIKNNCDDLGLANEAAIKQTLILPLFRVLGWNINDFNEVFPEYSTGNKRVDYSLKEKGENKVFIEVKKVREDLAMHQEQLLQYAFSDGVEIAVLTNGLSWWFYLPLNPGDWKSRKCFSIDITQQEEEIVKNFINFLEKENVLSKKSLENLKFAKEIYKQKEDENREKFRSIEYRTTYNKPDYEEKGYIDVKDNIFFKKIVDVCNLFGYNYKGCQRGWVRHPIEKGRFLWFPKIDYSGKWENRISADGLTMTERTKMENDNNKFISQYFLYDNFDAERVAFAGEIDPLGKFGYNFKGVFQIDKEVSQREGIAIHKRIDTRVKTYKINL